MLLSDCLISFKRWFAQKRKTNTAKGYCAQIRQFCVYCNNCDIESVTISHVLDWLGLLKTMGVQHNTFVGLCSALKMFFKYFDQQGLNVLRPSLIPVPRTEYTPPRILTEDIYRQLLAVIPHNNDPRHIRNRSIITLLWDTGCRVGELMSIKSVDVDVHKMMAIIKTEKTRGFAPVRQIFWNEFANDCLKDWLVKRSVFGEFGEFLFISCCGQKIGQQLTKSGVGEMLRRYSHRLEVPIINAHSFRHHFGQTLAIKGVNNSTISSLMGHSSVQSSYTYTRLAGQDLETKYREVMK